MIKQQHEKQLELPNIETGFYEFISKETISFPEIDIKLLRPRTDSKLTVLQSSFSF
tara:strand:+ start:650 stop:817 length:168 start_codon:yes stop_codon:yes gene_type:complete